MMASGSGTHPTFPSTKDGQRKLNPKTPPSPAEGPARPFCTLTDFSIRLMSYFLKEEGGAQGCNVCLSPFGIAVSLGMAIVGSGDASIAQVVKAVGAIDSNNMYRTCEKVLSMLNDATLNTKVSMGSKMFVSLEVPLLPEFNETLMETFPDGVGHMDFKGDPKQAAKNINDWASKVTEGKVKHLVKDGDASSSTRIMLASAIYFRGLWSMPFYGPVKAPFYVNARETAYVDMMESCRGALYCHSTSIQCQALQLSYLCKSLSLLLILPDKEVGLHKVVGALNQESVRRLFKELKPITSMAVFVPCFRIQRSHELAPALKSLGITILFDDQAVDLSRMTGTKHGLCVDSVVHESFFDTTTEGLGEATRPPEPLDANMIVFRADRPFMYMLLHHYNHAVVNIGVVYRP